LPVHRTADLHDASACRLADRRTSPSVAATFQRPALERSLIAKGFRARREGGWKPLFRRISMAEKPTLYVCHGDDGGPRFHPCRRVQEALRGAGIEYEKVIAAHGSPIPFLRRGS